MTGRPLIHAANNASREISEALILHRNARLTDDELETSLRHAAQNLLNHLIPIPDMADLADRTMSDDMMRRLMRECGI